LHFCSIIFAFFLHQSCIRSLPVFLPVALKYHTVKGGKVSNMSVHLLENDIGMDPQYRYHKP